MSVSGDLNRWTQSWSCWGSHIVSAVKATVLLLMSWSGCFWCLAVRFGPPQSTCCLASMHLTHGHYAWSWGYPILAMCQMRKSEEPPVVHRSLTWWLIDVCGSSDILLAVHLARTTIEPLQCVSDKYCPTGSNQQEDLATRGSVQLRQTLARWILASGLPGERLLLVMNGDILWTLQRSSRVHFERRSGCLRITHTAIVYVFVVFWNFA